MKKAIVQVKIAYPEVKDILKPIDMLLKLSKAIGKKEIFSSSKDRKVVKLKNRIEKHKRLVDQYSVTLNSLK